ncbi:MerR family transcriptional regulator [Patescibacteria group bacterium]
MKYHQKKPLFTISIAAQLAGLHPRTLALYEKSGLIKPHRTKTSRRHYSQADIEKIKLIHFLATTKKVNLSGIKIVFSLLEKTKKIVPNFSKEAFPEYFSSLSQED